MKQELKKNLMELERLEAAADIADEAYQNSPEDKEAERAFDEAHQAEYDAFMKVSIMISEFAGIDIKTAREMVRVKHAELLQYSIKSQSYINHT